MRSVLAEVADGVRSAPEADLRHLIKEAGMPMPLFNSRLYLPSGTVARLTNAYKPGTARPRLNITALPAPG